MTLCIAALSQWNDGPCVVAGFDRRVETDIAGADTEFKYEKLSDRWGALIAGDIALARELTTSYAAMFEVESDFSRFEVVSRLRAPINSLRESMADRLVRARLAMSLDDLKKHGKARLSDDVLRQIWYEIQSQELNVELILFEGREQGFRLFRLSGGDVARCEPFAAIGSGAFIAAPALYQREYDGFWPLERSLYAVYEAQRLGSIAPGVSRGPKSANIVAFHYDKEKGAIFPLVPKPKARTWLEKRFKALGPRSVPNDLSLPSDSFWDLSKD